MNKYILYPVTTVLFFGVCVLCVYSNNNNEIEFERTNSRPISMYYNNINSRSSKTEIGSISHTSRREPLRTKTQFSPTASQSFKSDGISPPIKSMDLEFDYHNSITYHPQEDERLPAASNSNRKESLQNDDIPHSSRARMENSKPVRPRHARSMTNSIKLEVNPFDFEFDSPERLRQDSGWAWPDVISCDFCELAIVRLRSLVANSTYHEKMREMAIGMCNEIGWVDNTVCVMMTDQYKVKTRQ